MRLYSENLKKDFQEIINTGEIKGDKKRREFAENKILPFLFELMDEIVSNDGLEKLERELFKDSGAAMGISHKNGKSYFSIEETGFYSKWVEHNKDAGMSKNMKDNYLTREINAVFHEERHHKQNKLMEEKDFFKMSPNTLIYIKEKLILNSDYTWYRNNHGKFWLEIEAHQYGYKGSIEFVLSAMPNSEFAKLYEERNLDAMNSLINPDGYLNGENPSSYVITDKFDELFKVTPPNVIKMVMQNYPILALVYNEDGSKKSVEEVLAKRQEMLKDNFKDLQKIVEIDGCKTTIGSHINRTFATIIKSDRELQSQYEEYMQKKETEKSKNNQKQNEVINQIKTTQSYNYTRR